jgi:hypothetical protein
MMDVEQKLAGLYGAIEDQQKAVSEAIAGLARERAKLGAAIDSIKNASGGLQKATGLAASTAVTESLGNAPKAAVGALNAATKALDEAADKVRDAGAWISLKFALVFVLAGAAAVATNYMIGRFTLPDRAEVETHRAELDAIRLEKAELEANIAQLAKRGGRIKFTTCGDRVCIEASSNQGKDTAGNPAPMGSWRTRDGRDVALVIPRGY